MKEEIRNIGRLFLHMAAGLVLLALCCMGGTVQAKAATAYADVTHDKTCECRSEGSQTVLPGSVHKFHVKVLDEYQNIVDDSKIKVDWHHVMQDNIAEVVKTDGTTGWMKLKGEDGDDRDRAFRIYVEYSFEDGHKDTVEGGVDLSWAFGCSDDFYIVPNMKKFVLLSGETKQLPIMARHYTSEYPEGNDIDVTQYGRWRAQNENYFTVSADGMVTAKKTGHETAFLDREKFLEALPEDWNFKGVGQRFWSVATEVFVVQNEEILTDLSKITLKGAEDEAGYVYFMPSYAVKYKLYGSDPEEWNDEYDTELIDLDTEGFGGPDVPVPGEIYLLRVPNWISYTDKIVTIRPVHEHESGQGVIAKEPTLTERGVRRYYCVHCGILVKTEYIPKLEPGAQPNTPSGYPGVIGDTLVPEGVQAGNILETQDAVYDVVSSGSGGTALSYRAPKQAVSSVTIPDTVWYGGKTYRVTGISAKAFFGSGNLRKVKIGSNVVSIGKQAFSGCSRLASVSGGKNVASIGESAFNGCKALRKITIGAKVTKIGKKAFSGCKKLADITVKTTKLAKKNVGKKAFSGTPSNASVKVPKNKLKAYRTLFGSRGIHKKAKIK